MKGILFKPEMTRAIMEATKHRLGDSGRWGRSGTYCMSKKRGLIMEENLPEIFVIALTRPLRTSNI